MTSRRTRNMAVTAIRQGNRVEHPKPAELHNSRKANLTRLDKAGNNQRRAAEYRAKFAPKGDQ